MTKFHATAVVSILAAGFLLTGCSIPTVSSTTSDEPTSDATVAATTEAPAATPAEATDSFVDGVLTTEDVTIKITDSRVIQPGETGNEYGDAPVIAFWYDTTNLGTADRDITPMEFLYTFEAFQDNDPNRENDLQVAGLPDDAFLETQTDSIKTGGTVSNAIAYTLSDTTTPVDLVAGTLFGDEIGRMTFTIN